MKINLSAFWNNSKDTVLRFPATIAFLAALTILMIENIILEKSPDWLTFFFSVGMLLTLLLHICTEEREEYGLSNVFKKPKAALLWLGSIAVLAADAYSLHLKAYIDESVYIAQSSAILAMLVAVCFFPFMGEKDDRKSWNFVLRLAVGAAIGILVGLIMLGGLCLLYMGSAQLFDFEAEYKVYYTLCVLCLVTLPVLLFLIRIPSGEDKFNSNVPKNKFLIGVTKFLFLPLTLLYMAVLYVYGLKILFTWTLPQGTLSMLVSVMMCSVIAITFLLYPYIRDKEYNGFEVKITLKLPLLSLPLLVLMSIGLGRRFMDYGITANRLYMLTFNIWLYAVALGLWLGKARRIHWISISFTMLVLITSVHPWNYNRIYQKILVNRFLELKAKYGIQQKDLDDYKFERILSKMPEKDALTFNNTISDIQSYGYIWSRSVLGENCQWVYHNDGKKIKDVDGDFHYSYEMDYSYSLNNVPLTDGYKYIEYLGDEYCDLLTDATTSEKDNIGYACNDSTFIYHLENHGDFLIRHKNLNDSVVYKFKSVKGDALLISTRISITDYNKNHKNMRLGIDGYILYNNPIKEE